ncbi:hypothetical protein J6Z19_05335 [bacterium]|nr:hypothetical protein [bacterium]
MKWFNCFLLVLLFFFAACDSVNGAKRVLPENEGDKEAETDEDVEEDDSDLTDTEDGDLVDDDFSDSEPADDDSSDSEPADDDSSDTEPNEGDSSDSEPANDDSTDDEPAGGEDEDVIPDSPEIKCNKAGGTWNGADGVDEAKKCYIHADCETEHKPANSEWNGDSGYDMYYNFEEGNWDVVTYTTKYGDGEPQPCQYKCINDYVYENGECNPKPQPKECAAVFNGESSRIEVASNDLLNLGSDSWTIEAWIKQDAGDLTSDYTPILRKGTSENPPYVLTGYRKQQSWGNVTYTVTGATTYKSTSTSTTENLQVDGTFNEFSGGWTHIALVHNTNVAQSTTYKSTLYVNGKQVNSKTYEPRRSMNLLEVNEPLVLGANLYSSWSVSKKYFKGLIDSIRISGSEKYTADFTPTQLSADDDTIAFWDFSGNFNETKNGLESAPTNVTFSTDCAF